MSKFMARLQQIRTDMVDDGGTLPRVVCSDRGPGFYQTSTGHITKDYAQALHQHGFRAFAGADASKQPPDLPDLLLHEKAVAWIKGCLKKHPFSGGVLWTSNRSSSRKCSEIAQPSSMLIMMCRDCAIHIHNDCRRW